MEVKKASNDEFEHDRARNLIDEESLIQPHLFEVVLSSVEGESNSIMTQLQYSWIKRQKNRIMAWLLTNLWKVITYSRMAFLSTFLDAA